MPKWRARPRPRWPSTARRMPGGAELADSATLALQLSRIDLPRRAAGTMVVRRAHVRDWARGWWRVCGPPRRHYFGGIFGDCGVRDFGVVVMAHSPAGFRHLLAACVVFATLASAAATAAEPRTALIVGNSAYTYARL